MRHVANSVGQILRGKTEYSVVVFSGQMIPRLNKQDSLPCQAQDCKHCLAIELCVQVGKWMHVTPVLIYLLVFESELASKFLVEHNAVLEYRRDK